MDPITTKIIVGIILLLISTTVGYLVYHNKRKDSRIDDIDKRLKDSETKIAVIYEKIQTIESTYPILQDIKSQLNDVSTSIRVIEADLKNLNKASDKADKDIDDLFKLHYHRRADDPK